MVVTTVLLSGGASFAQPGKGKGQAKFEAICAKLEEQKKAVPKACQLPP
jgi:hypothetical protein